MDLPQPSPMGSADVGDRRLAIGLVFMAEMANTAFEKLLDLIHPEHHPLVGRIKDMAAGMVLVSSLMSVVIGVIIFLPKLIEKLN